MRIVGACTLPIAVQRLRSPLQDSVHRCGDIHSESVHVRRWWSLSSGESSQLQILPHLRWFPCLRWSSDDLIPDLLWCHVRKCCVEERKDVCSSSWSATCWTSPTPWTTTGSWSCKNAKIDADIDSQGILIGKDRKGLCGQCVLWLFVRTVPWCDYLLGPCLKKYWTPYFPPPKWGVPHFKIQSFLLVSVRVGHCCNFWFYLLLSFLYVLKYIINTNMVSYTHKKMHVCRVQVWILTRDIKVREG